VLTSPRAAEALGSVLERRPAAQAAWGRKPVLVVGPRTAGGVRRLGLQPEGEQSGSAEALAGYLAARPLPGPLLFLSGNRRREVLPASLAASGLAFEELCVYETRVEDAPAAASLPLPAWIVFFSPSGVEALEAGAGASWASARKAALGATTAAALAGAGWQVDVVAARPTPEALAQALLDVGAPS
jgi:uroporphyrinogen-III synthase